MKDLQHFLRGKLKKFSPSDSIIRDTFVEVVEGECDIRLKNFEVKVSRDVIFVTTNPVIKSEIMIRRAAILRACSERLLGKESIRDVR